MLHFQLSRRIANACQQAFCGRGLESRSCPIRERAAIGTNPMASIRPLGCKGIGTCRPPSPAVSTEAAGLLPVFSNDRIFLSY